MAELLPSDELIEEPSDFGSLRPGNRLGRYELLVPIARGGMARVWAARLHGQRGFQKLVAVKTILPHLANEPEFERMFLDEARIACGVHHPNVCEIYELGEEKSALYLAMEWVSGDSFSRVLRPAGRTEAIDARVVARLIADACAGLHAAHELVDEDGRALDVVHRDLSPHNILLTADGNAKVCDFGVAKALGQLHEATSAGQLKGKVAYMAPEQVTGSAIDRRSDIFSLGVVLYEATTGQRPFRGDGEPQVMHAVLKGEYEPPSSIVKGYSPELERIVQRALSPQALLRFPTAERMRFALEEFLAKGQLVTQSNVAQVVKQRIGESLERRRERIRQASSAGDRDGWSGSEPPGASMTPSNQNAHRSGVKQATAKPLFTTLQIPPGQSPTRTQPPPPLPPSPEALGLQPASGTLPPPPNVPEKTPRLGIAPATPPPPAVMPLSTTLAMPTAVSMPMPMPPPPQPSPVMTIPPSSGPMNESTGQHVFGPGFGAPPPSHAPVAPVSDPSPGGGAGHYALAAMVGVLLAVVIGVGGYIVWARRRAEPPPLIVTTAPAHGSSAAPMQAAPASAAIEFRLTPKDATITIDGIELAPGARTVSRPEVGKTVMVVVHAKGFDDTTVLVDWFTTSPMELALKPASGPAQIELGDAPPTPAGDPSAAADPGGGASSADKPEKKKPTKRPDQGVVPANPY